MTRPIVLPHERAGSRVLIYQDGRGVWRVACYVGETQRPTWDIEAKSKKDALREAEVLGAKLEGCDRGDQS